MHNFGGFRKSFVLPPTELAQDAPVRDNKQLVPFRIMGKKLFYLLDSDKVRARESVTWSSCNAHSFLTAGR